MLTDAEVKALELKGLTYWQCEGKDYALNLKSIESKEDELKRDGIALFRGLSYCILYPANWCGTVKATTTIPLVFSEDGIHVGPRDFYENSLDYFYKWLGIKFNTVDLSNTYIRSGDIDGLTSQFQHVRDKVVLSSTLDKPSITSLGMMFYGSEVKEVDFTNFRGTYVTNISNMFEDCEDLEIVNLSNATFENVEQACSVFELCEKLKTIHLSNATFENVRDSNNMFSKCTNLKELYLPNATFKNLKYAESMFARCERLEELNLPNTTFENLKHHINMFYECKNLRVLNLLEATYGNVCWLLEGDGHLLRQIGFQNEGEL